MKSATYFVISNIEGRIRVDALPGERVLARITPGEHVRDNPDSGYEGKNHYGQERPVFLSKMPTTPEDMGHDELVIIRGEVVVPEPVVKVQTFKMPESDR